MDQIKIQNKKINFENQESNIQKIRMKKIKM